MPGPTTPSPTLPSPSLRLRDRVPARLGRLGRLDLAIAAVLLAGVILKAVLFAQVWHTPFSGDEVYYSDAGKALSNLLRDLAALRAPDGAELDRDVIGSGWFMPGMGILLTPLYLVDPHAGPALARGWLGLITLAVLVVAVLDVRRVLGRWWAIGFAVIPAMVPMWILFSYTAYGDLLAGLVATLLITRMLAILRAAGTGTAPSVGDGALVGFLAIATVYLRSSSTPLVFGVGVLGLLALLWTGRRALAPLVVAGALFLALLAPWSLAASLSFHARVVTTTSVPMAMANTFGDRTQVCYGMCDPGSTIWFSPVRYAREVARATGASEVTVLGQMSAYARQHVTAHSYARDVIVDWHHYIDDPTAFLFKLRPPGDTVDDEEQAIKWWTEVPFRIMVALAAGGLLLVTRRSRRDQLLSVLVKVGLLGLLLQPFVHLAGSRYWTTAAPLAALAAMLLVRVVLGVVQRIRGQVATPEGGPPARILTLAQAALAAIAVAAVVVINVLAAQGG